MQEEVEEGGAQDPEAASPHAQPKQALRCSLQAFTRQLDGILLEVLYAAVAVPNHATARSSIRQADPCTACRPPCPWRLPPRQSSCSATCCWSSTTPSSRCGEQPALRSWPMLAPPEHIPGHAGHPCGGRGPGRDGRAAAQLLGPHRAGTTWPVRTYLLCLPLVG